MGDGMGKSKEDILDTVYKLAKNEEHRKDRELHIIELLGPYLKKRPQHAYAWYLYGDSLRVIGRAKDALAAFKRALKLVPLEYKGTVYARMGMLCEEYRSPSEAKQWFNLATQTGQCEVGWIWIYKGGNLASLNEFEGALECYRNALTKEDVDKDEIFLNIGYVLRAMGNYTEAVASFREALKITPEYQEAQSALDGLVDIQKTIKVVAKIRGNKIKKTISGIE